jgi:hypothetical protein
MGVRTVLWKQAGMRTVKYGFINLDSEIMFKYQEAMEHRQMLGGPEHFLNEEYPILEMIYLLPDIGAVQCIERN